MLTIATIVYIRDNMKTQMLHEKAQQERAELGDVTQTRVSDEIPFGLRAMEEEPEVEGVWNSRTCTPLHLPIGREMQPTLRPASIPMTAHQRNTSSLSSVSHLDIAETVTPPIVDLSDTTAPGVPTEMGPRKKRTYVIGG